MSGIENALSSTLRHALCGACAIYRYNDGIVKTTEIVVDGEGVPQRRYSNKILLSRFLWPEMDRDDMISSSLEQINIIEDDSNNADSIITYYSGLTFSVIAGKMSDWDRSILNLLAQNEVGFRDIGLISVLPQSWQRAVSRDEVDSIIKWAKGGYIGKAGDKVNLTARVLRSVWSKQWSCYWITCLTLDDQPVFFSLREVAPNNNVVLKLRGRVKGHVDGLTQLSRVVVEIGS